jgi:hypothetical protein
MERIDEHRSRVPLVMLDGNIEALMKNTIPVESIQLREVGPGAFVLMIQWSPEQEKHANALGFRTSPIST